MSDKVDCPGCGYYGSSVLTALQDESRMPCCGLSWAATVEILEIRGKKATDEVTKAAEEAVKRAEKAEREAAHLRTQIQAIQEVLSREQPDPKDTW